MQMHIGNVQALGTSQGCGVLAAKCVSRLQAAQLLASSSRDRCNAVQKAVLRGADVCVQASPRRSLATQVGLNHKCAAFKL